MVRTDTEIRMRGVSLTLEDAAKLADQIRSRPRLRVVELRFVSIGFDSASASFLAEAIGASDSLEELCLVICHLNDDDAVSIAHGISKCKSLRDLDLYGNYIHDRGAMALAAALPFCKDLKWVQLGGNLLSGKGVMALSGALSRCESLKDIGYDQADVSDATRDFYWESLKQAPLRRAFFAFFCLTDNNMGDGDTAIRRRVFRMLLSN